jgi:DNA processing protein
MMMKRGRSHEVLLSLLLSGVLSRKKIADSLLQSSAGDLAGLSAARMADRLGLDNARRRLFERTMPEAIRICAGIAAAGARIMSLADPDYPSLLKETAVPPPLLFHKGSLDVICPGAIAIVGSRRASFGGRKLASHLASELADRGFTVVSGLARGVDTAAHRGALEAGGRTVAVMGCGIDIVYPSENEGLARSICGSGALVTEFVPGTPPLRQNFPMRNRIISGLSLGTVVVEAAEKSGALITAGFALEQNRSVFAVPGAPGIPGSRGSNGLLKQGARLVESVEDILEEIDPQIARQGRADGSAGTIQCSQPDEARLSAPGAQGLTREEQKLVDLLSDRPAHVDELSRSLGMEAHVTLGLLLMLEARGLARSMPGKFYVKETLL